MYLLNTKYTNIIYWSFGDFLDDWYVGKVFLLLVRGVICFLAFYVYPIVLKTYYTYCYYFINFIRDIRDEKFFFKKISSTLFYQKEFCHKHDYDD